MHIPCKFRDGKTYVTSQEELNIIRKNDLNNLHLECEILKLRKHNLLENIANQDKALEEKIREGKIKLHIKKEILFYRDCDVTEYIEYVNKKWDNKILGMTKAYEKEKCFLKQKLVFIQLHHHPTLHSTMSKKIWKVLQTKTCHSREQTCNVQTPYQKIDKIQKTKINQRYEKR